MLPSLFFLFFCSCESEVGNKNPLDKPLPSLVKRVPVATGGCFVESDVVRREQNTRHAKIRRHHSDLHMISRATLFAKEGFRSDFLRSSSTCDSHIVIRIFGDFYDFHLIYLIFILWREIYEHNPIA